MSYPYERQVRRKKMFGYLLGIGLVNMTALAEINPPSRPAALTIGRT